MTTFGRMRLDMDEAEFLWEILIEARNDRIGHKVTVRGEDDNEFLATQWELKTIHRMMEETKRVMKEIE